MTGSGRALGVMIPHAIAAAAALTYAWFLSQTGLRHTGLQFVTPVIVILLSHLAWFAARGWLTVGFAGRLYGQAALTAVFLIAALILGAVLAPQPAHADVGEAVGVVLTILFCAAIIAIVVGAIALFFMLLWRLARWVATVFGGDDAPKGRFFDVGSLIASLTVLGLASLEGVPGRYHFAAANVAVSARFVEAPPDAVWSAMQTATSPDFDLPGILALLPQPVAVPVDEGVGLGANRVVSFEGREGAGQLHLRVVARTDTSVVFAVLTDTTPYADWITYRHLTYRVVPDEGGTRLSVEIAFERRLAPAWFFGPMMRGASRLAADVLVRDVKARSVF